MKNNNLEWLQNLFISEEIAPEDIPDIELYMDQVTTFMETKLEGSRRYEDDKIMTKTMINNYTKNKLLPPSHKKRYNRKHVLMLIMIYYLKNMMSISDIQHLLSPLSNEYFYHTDKDGITIEEIYNKVTELNQARKQEVADELEELWEKNRDCFDSEKGDTAFLDDFAFIFQLCYDIYIRKKIIESIIDGQRRKSGAAKPKKEKKEKKEKK